MKVLWVTDLFGRDGQSALQSGGTAPARATAAALAALRGSPGLELAVVLSGEGARNGFQMVDGMDHYVVAEAGAGYGMDPAALRQAIGHARPGIVHVDAPLQPRAAAVAAAFGGPLVVTMGRRIGTGDDRAAAALPLARWACGLHRPRRALLAANLLAEARFATASGRAAEEMLLRRADRIVGRTGWDRAYAALLGPCTPFDMVMPIQPASLEDLSAGPRQYERNSIFLASADDAQSGAHIVIQALALLCQNFDNISLVIGAGRSPHVVRSSRSARRYRAYLAWQIETLGLMNRVRFAADGSTGPCDYGGLPHAHIFVSPSLAGHMTEPLGEAMMLAMPCVCAFAGGAPEFARPDREALYYRAEDPVGLAHQLARVMRCAGLGEALGAAARRRAMTIFDRAASRDRLLAGYRALAGQARSTDIEREAA